MFKKLSILSMLAITSIASTNIDSKENIFNTQTAKEKLTADLNEAIIAKEIKSYKSVECVNDAVYHIDCVINGLTVEDIDSNETNIIEIGRIQAYNMEEINKQYEAVKSNNIEEYLVPGKHEKTMFRVTDIRINNKPILEVSKQKLAENISNQNDPEVKKLLEKQFSGYVMVQISSETIVDLQQNIRSKADVKGIFGKFHWEGSSDYSQRKETYAMLKNKMEDMNNSKLDLDQVFSGTTIYNVKLGIGTETKNFLITLSKLLYLSDMKNVKPDISEENFYSYVQKNLDFAKAYLQQMVTQKLMSDSLASQISNKLDSIAAGESSSIAIEIKNIQNKNLIKLFEEFQSAMAKQDIQVITKLLKVTVD